MMGKWLGIFALAVALATAALLTHSLRERRAAERAQLLWLYAVQLDAERSATAAAGGDPVPAAPSANATAAEAASAATAHNPATLPILLAVDPRSGLAVLQSANALTHIIGRNQPLPASPWRLDDLGPDFVELSNSPDGNRQRLRLYRQDLHRPHRLISDRIETPTVERMILLPLQPVTEDANPATSAPQTTATPPGTAGVPPADHAPPPSPDSGAMP
jgi:hypothetical protein